MTLVKNVFKPLGKTVLTTAVSAKDEAIHEKMFGSGAKTLLILNEEINHIMKIVKSFEKSGLLILFIFH